MSNTLSGVQGLIVSLIWIKSGLARNYGIDLKFISCFKIPVLLPLILDIFVNKVRLWNRRGIRIIGALSADSAPVCFAVPVMPTWLGNQQNTMLKDWTESSWYFNRIWRVTGLQVFLLAMTNEKVDVCRCALVIRATSGPINETTTYWLLTVTMSSSKRLNQSALFFS